MGRRDTKSVSHVPIPSKMLDLVDELFNDGELRLETFVKVAEAAKIAAKAGIVPEDPEERSVCAYLEKATLADIEASVRAVRPGKYTQGTALILGIQMAVEAKRMGLVSRHAPQPDRVR